MQNNSYITLDIDWAPDFVIDYVADLFIANNVKATWFVTHKSKAVDRLRDYPHLFELGIHPNFLPNSSHGNTVDEVLDFCMNLVPEAVSMRTHALVQSTLILSKAIQKTPVKYDVSLFLAYHPHLQSVDFFWGANGKYLKRLPYNWEDDFEMEHPNANWHGKNILNVQGIKVYDFHPIHIYLNSSKFETYLKLKEKHPDINSVPREEILPFIENGEGTLSFLKLLFDKKKEIKFLTINEYFS